MRKLKSNQSTMHTQNAERTEYAQETFIRLLHWAGRDFPLTAKHTLLEYGCGRIGVARFYKPFVHRVIAVDINDFSKEQREVEFIKYNGVKLPLADGETDRVVSHSVLEHVSDINSSVAEIDRVLKVGGLAYLTVSPLYYSSGGHHVRDNAGQRLTNWEHLNPASELFETTDPIASTAQSKGHSLNKLTVETFLAAVGRVPWDIVRMNRNYEHKPLPDFLEGSNVSKNDLITKEFRFIGIKTR